MKVNNPFLKKLGWYTAGSFVLLTVIQIIQSPVTNPEVSLPFKAPEEVTVVLRKACYDCHSNETRLTLYDRIAPVSWLVSKDVATARSRFNFSNWDTLSRADQQTRLWEMVNMVLDHKMPLSSYVTFHPEAKLTGEDIAVLKRYVNSLNPTRYHDTVVINQANRQYLDYQLLSQPTDRELTAPNGVKFVNGFHDWQIISTIDRFDNHTMRVVYGNDIAIKAIKENTINPWPDGTTLVKVVWNSIEEVNGDVIPGAFNNIQIMTKDDAKYPDSKGWGFAKFIGTQLKPYGDSPSFNATCFNCHKAVSDHGYVFDVPFTDQELKSKLIVQE